MQLALLTLNAGSSSLKFSLFAVINNNYLEKILYGQIEILDAQAKFLVSNDKDELIVKKLIRHKADDKQNFQALALNTLLAYLNEMTSSYTICAVGHRVVHGGDLYKKPTLIHSKIIAQLEQYIPLAPLHQFYNIAGIKLLAKLIPNIFQVACFDTAFHATQPEVAQVYALPDDLAPIAIKRYGFHGLSYEYIAKAMPNYLGDENAKGKIIVAHLGHGASMCAMKNKKSIATTMGFTALDGLPMGTRCGNIDPGIILYLLQNGMSLTTLSELLYKQAGLKGLSKISGDIRQLLKSAQPLAKKAIDVFIYRMQRELGSLIAALEGLDSLIFTAGIGENSAEIRSRLCKKINWLPLLFDEDANQKNTLKISKNDSKISVWVIPTNEELIIAQHTFNLWKKINNHL